MFKIWSIYWYVVNDTRPLGLLVKVRWLVVLQNLIVFYASFKSCNPYVTIVNQGHFTQYWSNK